MDPSYLQLSRIKYQEQLHTVAKSRRFGRMTKTGSDVSGRVLARLGETLIVLGRQLQADRQTTLLPAADVKANRR